MSTLNVDILLVVASFCDQSTLCMLIGTCKTLYRTAARYALGERAVVLRSDRQIERFLRFMRPQHGQRWKLLRELEIDTDFLERPYIAKTLASAILKATHLEKLKLAPTKVILGSHPDLGPAFASLPSVKHVEIVGVSGLTCRMLEDMRWPLETAIIERLSIHDLWKDDINDYNAINPIEMLRNARRTLRSLSLDTWLGWRLRSPDIPVYPNMKSLAVMHGHCPPTGPWAMAFPDLEHLKIYTLEHACLDVSDEALEIQFETREENREEHLSRGTWNKLESFKGAALDLYLVGVPCHIRHLKLGVSREELLFLPAALSDARPTILDLDIYSRMLKGGDNDWMLEHLRDPALNAVRVLNLRLKLHLPCIADVPDFLVCRMTGLSSVQVAHCSSGLFDQRSFAPSPRLSLSQHRAGKDLPLRLQLV